MSFVGYRLWIILFLFLIKSKYIKLNNPKYITTGNFQEVQKFALKN